MKKISLFFLSMIIVLAAHTQTPSIDLTFNTSDKGFGAGDGIDGAVRGTAIQRNGKIIVAGDFYTYNGTTKPYLIRLNTDGSLDGNFATGSGVDNQVAAVAVQTNDRIIIGGFFFGYDGIPRNNIARLTKDGALDQSFDPGTGTNGYVSAIAVQPDGKILVGGLFTEYDGSSYNYIVRLNANGTPDQSFRSALEQSGIDGVTVIAVQSDGKILLGGNFTDPVDAKVRKIIRLNRDGSIDETFRPKSHADDTVLTIGIQQDGRILIGGALSVYNYPVRNHIVRLQADGSLDESFRNIGTGDWASLVNKLIVQENGSILIGGGFTSHDGQPRNRINRLNADGSTDRTFNPGSAANGEIAVMMQQPDGKIVLAGEFTAYDNKNAVRLTRVNRDGSLDTGFNAPGAANSTVTSIAVQADSKIIIGGGFTGYFGDVRNTVARLNQDGSVDHSFDPGTGGNSFVQAVTLQPDNKVIAGGYFTSFNGISCNHIARLNNDGSVDRTFNCHTDFPVSSIAVQADGKIIIAGTFTRVNGIAVNRLARLLQDGSMDTGFNTGIGANGGIEVICIQPDGKILVGGHFTTFNGVNRSRVVRLNANGSVDTGFIPSTGPLSGSVRSIVLDAHGRVLIAGDLHRAGNPEFSEVIRLNEDGSYNEDFDAGAGANSIIYSMSLQPDGKVLLGGYFTWFNGLFRNYLVRLHENGVPDESFDINAADYVNTLAMQGGSKLLVGGAFTNINNIGRNRLARVDLATDIRKKNVRSFTMSAVSSITKNESGISIYPVPASHTLYISNPLAAKMKIVILDNLGKKLHEADLQGTKLSVDVSGWTNGIYHVIATDRSTQKNITLSFLKK